MGRWTLAAVRRTPDIPLILDETSQDFTACMASLLGGTDLGVSRLQKRKAGTGMPGETPSLSPCATRVLFSTCAFQHLCFSALSHSLSAGKSFQLGLWCFSASCFSTQWDLKILKCSRMDSAWKVPDKTDTKKAPFNYIIFNSCMIGSYMDSCHVN